MKVFIIADIEGGTGVVKHSDETDLDKTGNTEPREAKLIRNCAPCLEMMTQGADTRFRAAAFIRHHSRAAEHYPEGAHHDRQRFMMVAA